MVRVWYTPEEETHTEDVLDENGNPVYDEKGNKKTTTVTTTTKVEHSEQVKYADISVKYKCVPKDGARRYILDYFHVSNEKENDSDMSDEDIVDEQVAQLRKMYNAKEAAFSDSSDLEIGADVDIGNLVAGKDMQKAIDEFYATHTDDELFDAPELIRGPWENWTVKPNLTSHLNELRGGTPHNGTDTTLKINGVKQHHVELKAGSKCIVVNVQKGYANGVYSDSWNGTNGERGNFVLVYYGQHNGSGYFVLYQHLSPDYTLNIGDEIPAEGLIGYTGYTGHCEPRGSSNGEHLHLEMYLGGRGTVAKKVNPEKNYMTK